MSKFIEYPREDAKVRIDFAFVGPAIVVCPHCSGELVVCPVCAGQHAVKLTAFRLLRADDLQRLMETCDPIRHEDFDAFRRLEAALGTTVDPRASKWGSKA